MKLQIMVLSLLATLFLSPPQSKALMILPVTLDNLSKEADIIFKGVCEAKQQGTFTYPETGEVIPIWTYTFRIEEMLKGNAGNTIEVKQWAVPSTERTLKSGHGPFLETASFDVGKEYLLFLTIPSDFGFRAAIGFNQGKFSVSKDAQGKSVVVNSFNNRGLLQGMSPRNLSKSQKALLEAPPGPLPYDELVPLIKKSLDH